MEPRVARLGLLCSGSAMTMKPLLSAIDRYFSGRLSPSQALETRSGRGAEGPFAGRVFQSSWAKQQVTRLHNGVRGNRAELTAR